MMLVSEVIKDNGGRVTRKDLCDIFTVKVGQELYNLAFNALGEDLKEIKEVTVRLTAKVSKREKLTMPFTDVLELVGRVAAHPQSNYQQAVKSHNLWNGRILKLQSQLMFHQLEVEHDIMTEAYNAELKAHEE